MEVTWVTISINSVAIIALVIGQHLHSRKIERLEHFRRFFEPIPVADPWIKHYDELLEIFEGLQKDIIRLITSNAEDFHGKDIAGKAEVKAAKYKIESDMRRVRENFDDCLKGLGLNFNITERKNGKRMDKDQ